MIANYLSLFLGVIEMMVFSNAFYGMPFVQFIFKNESIYMNEKCNETQIENGIFCEAAEEALGRIWTVGVMVASAGPVIFGYIQPKIGLCYTRMICGTSTTIGLFMMSYYKTNPNFLFYGSLFLALPAISYIVLNTVIAPLYKKITVILIIIIPGLVNSSATCFLISKKLWQKEGIQLEFIFMVLAIASLLIHARTIFLMPFYPIPKDTQGYSLYENSMFFHLVFKKKEKIEKDEISEKSKSEGFSLKQYLPIISQLNYWCYLFYYTIITFRINTIRGWMYTWIQWTFSMITEECSMNSSPSEIKQCEEEAHDQVSTLLDINGYSYFALALIPFIPAMMVKFITYCLKSGISGKVYGLIIIMSYCIAFSIINSLQMCKLAMDVEDTANTLALIFISVSIVPLHYSTPCVFLTTFFPMEFFPFLYGIMKIPSIILMVVNEPLYGMILQGDEIKDAEFGPVSIGLGIVSGITVVCVVYIFFQGRKLIKEIEEKENSEEAQKLKEIEN